jgi:hypothetical protein
MTIKWPEAWREILAWIKGTFQSPDTVPVRCGEWVTIGAS